MSTSDGSTADGSIVIDTSSCLPVTTALTTPPPAEPSTWASRSSASMRAISCCICWAIRCRLPIPMSSLLLWPRGDAESGGSPPGLHGGWSGHLAHIHEIVGEDPASLADEVRRLARCHRRNVLEVGRHAADADDPPENPPDAILEHRPAALERILEEALVLGEAQRHDGPVDADGTAG